MSNKSKQENKESEQDINLHQNVEKVEQNETDLEKLPTSEAESDQVHEPSTDQKEDTQPTTDELRGQINELHEKILDLQQQIKDEAVRSLANIQNLQRRHKNELDDAYKYASTKFAKEMLPVRDYLEMALMDESGNFEALKKGVELTLNQLNTAFGLVSIKEVSPVKGEVFDPNKHNAVSTKKSEEASNTVLEVLQKGYVMNDRILRPAMVVVSSAE